MKPTLAQLERQWWWRKSNNSWTYNAETSTTHAAKAEEGFKVGLWKGGVETGAFEYELARRHPDAPRDLPPFPDLPDLLACELVSRFGKSEVVWIETCQWSGAMKPEPGYSLPSIWPLHLPNYTLETRFKKFIAEQRAMQGVTPKRGRAAECSRGPAWRLVELLDLARYGVRGKATLAHSRDFDQRRYMEAKTRCNAAWRKLKDSQLLQDYLPK